jgi:hypothetical protein
MNFINVLDTLLPKICADSRIKDGIFKIRDIAHLDILKEYLKNQGFKEQFVSEYLTTIKNNNHKSIK